ncbi:MAG: SDR family oxidoreductase [Candidatus Protistobacter heckmanni]|nr:SDR family oxidoreductase [Candidatus Protistobacter heckmanni]
MAGLPQSLAGRVAVVTGGASGAGAAICEEFARRGATVVIADWNEVGAQALATALRGEGCMAQAMAVDVTRSVDVGQLAEQVRREHGGAGILVNNAGVRAIKSFLEHSDEDWERMLSINLTGQFYCARALAPAMVERKWGRIINIASIASFVGRPDRVAYCAAKAVILGLTCGMAADLRHTGVTVNAIAPGSIATPLNHDAAHGLQRRWLDAGGRARTSPRRRPIWPRTTLPM